MIVNLTDCITIDLSLGKESISLPINATLGDILRIKFNYDMDTIRNSGLEKTVENAEEKLESILNNASKIMKPIFPYNKTEEVLYLLIADYFINTDYYNS